MIRFLATLGLGIFAAAPQPAQAHLLPKQSATMRVVDNSAFFVVSVPLSALHDVDSDGDGRLSVEEIRTHELDIVRQFELGFDVKDRENPITKSGSWVTPPETDEGHGDGDYVVIMHRIDFAAPPVYPTVTINLFGQSEEESQFSFRASRDGMMERVILARKSPVFTFFTAG